MSSDRNLGMALPNVRVGNGSVPAIPDKETLLQQTYLEAFQANYDSLQRWTKWKEDHEQVKETMTSLPDRLTHDVVIPFGSKALVKGKLVHTNEVLTCLGDKWFVKQSCKQAIEMCTRRINQSELMLKMLESEQTLLLNRQKLPKLEEAFPSDDAQQIIEEYDEKKEAEWRVGHRRREREFKQKLAQLRKQEKNKSPLETDDDVFRRLDELELEEELNDELERLHAEYEAHYEEGGEESEDSEEESNSEGDSEDQNEEKEKYQEKDYHKETSSQLSCMNKLPSKEANHPDVGILHDEESLSDTQCFANVENMNKMRRVSFADDSHKEQSSSCKVWDEDIFIKFKHSEQPSPISAQFGALYNQTPEIHSPSDIYDYHKALSMKCQPKSILKNSQSLPGTFEANFSSAQTQPFGSTMGLSFPDTDDIDNETSTHTRDLSHLPPVLCDIKERSPIASQSHSIPSETNPQRPVSLFKAARRGARR